MFSNSHRLGELLAHIGSGLELGITPHARELFHNWYMNLERSIHAKRLDTYALRLMTLLAVNELKQEIDEITVRQAIDLCDWQLQMRRLLDPIDADTKTAKMEEKIRRTLATGPKKDRELKQKTHANRAGLWAYRTAKENLLREKEIRLNKTTISWEMIS